MHLFIQTPKRTFSDQILKLFLNPVNWDKLYFNNAKQWGNNFQFETQFSLYLIAGFTDSVEVHFESKDGGFFLKHSPRQFYPINARPDFGVSLPANSGISPAAGSYPGSTPPSPSGNGPEQQNASSGGSILSVDKFTVFQTSEPVSIRASYGPFSTKQTVPARYIVPDPMDMMPISPTSDPRGRNANGTVGNAVLEAQELGTRHLDMSAHVVSKSCQYFSFELSRIIYIYFTKNFLVEYDW